MIALINEVKEKGFMRWRMKDKQVILLKFDLNVKDKVASFFCHCRENIVFMCSVANLAVLLILTFQISQVPFCYKALI